MHFFLYRYGFSPAINSYSAFGFSCTGNESSLSQCSEPGAVCRTDNADFAIAIECGGQTSPSKYVSYFSYYSTDFQIIRQAMISKILKIPLRMLFSRYSRFH